MKKARFFATITKKMRDYPMRSQELEDAPIFVMKLFNAFWPGTWFLTEYDPNDRIAFGYVTWLIEDEWGYISIDELADLTFHGVPMIEIDRHHKPVATNIALMEEPHFVQKTSLP